MIAVAQSQLLTKFNGNEPASAAAIAEAQASLNFPLPSDYVQFLQRTNGGEGFIGEHYLMAWRVEDFMQQNIGTYYAEAAPGLLPFGSNGGGEAFAFDTRSTPPSIVMVPFIGMELDTAIPIAPGFDEFLQVLYRSESLFDLSR